MKNKDKILDLLISSDDYVSGEKLSQELNVSRTAIWKNINRLKEEGYIIDSVTNKGYRLMSQPKILTESQLLNDLKAFGFTYIQLDDTVDSTNLEAKRKADAFKGHGCFVAREQTAGKGRRGREWNSPKDAGCYVSLLLRPNLMPSDAAMITLIAGLALAKTLNKLYCVEARIKWPNDIVIQGKKVAGILTEMSAEIERINYLIVGIGLNVSQKNFPEEIANIATSLEKSYGHKEVNFNRHDYIKILVTEFMDYMHVFLKTHDLRFINQEYQQLCLNINGELRIEHGSQSYTGIGQGITDHGELNILTNDGKIVTVNSGEVSVRGLYGYV